jgi:hypothetical protein
MMADPTTRDKLMDPNATQAGVGYSYSPQFPATHLWAAISAKLIDPPADNPAFFASAAGQNLKSYISDRLGADVADGLDAGKPGGGGGGASGGGSWSERWKPNTEYGVGAQITASLSDGWSMMAQNIGRYGFSGENEPLWPGPMGTVVDNEVVWLVQVQIPPDISKEVLDFYLLVQGG